MQTLTTASVWLMLALLTMGTLAIISRFTTWGMSGWLTHRLNTERMRATRLQAQAQVETAHAKERATRKVP